MAKFMIETESVSSSGDSIKTISSELSSLSSNVSGYDVNCEDNFNFSGAKQVIAHNIEACSTKMSNTSKLIETVVSAHNSLQSKLKFNEEKSSEDSDKSGNSSNDSPGNYSGNHSGSHGRRSSGGSHSSGSYSGGSYYGGSALPGFASSNFASTLAGTLDNQKVTGEATSTLLDGKFSSVAYAAPNEESLNEDAKKFLNDDNLIYKDGYAMIDGRYVISCDSSYGKIGDIIQFTKNDGSVVECIIGVNTLSEKYKSTINFIVDKDNPPACKTEFFEKIVENSSKIENIGNVNSNTNSSISTAPSQSVTGSSSTTTESSENSTSTESNSTKTQSGDGNTSTESNSTTTQSGDGNTSTESDVPVTNDEKITPVDDSADFVLANNSSSSFNDEKLNSLMNAKTDEDVQNVVNSIINDSSNNSDNI